MNLKLINSNFKLSYFWGSLHIYKSHLINIYSTAFANGEVQGGLIGGGELSIVGNSYYLANGNSPGYSGAPRTLAQLKDKENYEGWWLDNSWNIKKGFSPSLPHIPRSNVSYYPN